MPAGQKARLDVAGAGGFVLGGIAAVPTVKIADRDMTRLGGTTRWETAQPVERRASGDTTAGTSTTTGEIVEDSEDGNEDGDTEGEPEEVAAIPDPVLGNAEFRANAYRLRDFLESCGYWDGTTAECGDPADTLTVKQMKDDFYGCDFNMYAGMCTGWSLLDTLTPR